MSEHEAKVPLYFELPLKDRTALPNDLISEEEQYVLWEINHGRRMLSVPFEGWDSRADGLIAPVPAEDDDRFTTYYDAISNLLQAAVHEGLDAGDLCQAAIHIQRLILKDAHDRAADVRGAGHNKG